MHDLLELYTPSGTYTASYSKANLGRNGKRPDEAAWNNVILPILELQKLHFTKS